MPGGHVLLTDNCLERRQTKEKTISLDGVSPLGRAQEKVRDLLKRQAGF